MPELPHADRADHGWPRASCDLRFDHVPHGHRRPGPRPAAHGQPAPRSPRRLHRARRRLMTVPAIPASTPPPSELSTITIVIADDHRVVRAALRLLLEAQVD